MGRSLNGVKLDTRSARAKLEVRAKPYWALIFQGLHLGYYRGAWAASWLVRYLPAKGDDYVQAVLGIADDTTSADGAKVLTYAQAVNAAHAWYGDVRSGTQTPTRPYRVNEALDDYLKAFTGKSLDKTRHVIEPKIRPDLGKLLVADLTTSRLSQFLRDLAERPATYRANRKGERKLRPVSSESLRTRRASANRALTPLKAALNLAFQGRTNWGDRAWRRVKPFSGVSSPRIRYFTASEVGALLKAAEPNFRAIIQADLFTGSRWSELYRARVKDVDLDAGVIHFPETKGGRPHVVHLTEPGVEFLRTQCADRNGADALFLNVNGRPYGPSHQTRPMREACIAAKIEPAGFHILRHTYGSTLAMAGVPMAVIAQALGHADERITSKHYAHLSPSYVQESVRAGLGSLGSFESRD